MRYHVGLVLTLALAGCAQPPQPVNVEALFQNYRASAARTSRLPREVQQKLDDIQSFLNKARSFENSIPPNLSSANREYTAVIDKYGTDPDDKIVSEVKDAILARAENILKGPPEQHAGAITDLRAVQAYAQTKSDILTLLRAKNIEQNYFRTLLDKTPAERSAGIAGLEAIVDRYRGSAAPAERRFTISVLLDLAEAFQRDPGPLEAYLIQTEALIATLKPEEQPFYGHRIRFLRAVSRENQGFPHDALPLFRSVFDTAAKSGNWVIRGLGARSGFHIAAIHSALRPVEAAAMVREVVETFGKDKEAAARHYVVRSILLLTANPGTDPGEAMLFAEMGKQFLPEVATLTPNLRVRAYLALAAMHAQAQQTDSAIDYLTKADEAVSAWELSEKPPLEKDRIAAYAYAQKARIYLELGESYRPQLEATLADIDRRFADATEAAVIEGVLSAYETRLALLHRPARQPYAAGLPVYDMALKRFGDRRETRLVPSLVRLRYQRAMAYREEVPPNVIGLLGDAKWIIDRAFNNTHPDTRKLVARALLMRGQAMETIDLRVTRDVFTKLMMRHKNDPDAELRALAEQAEAGLHRIGP